MVEVEGIDDVPVEDIDDERFRRPEPPATPWRKAGKKKKKQDNNASPAAPPVAPARADNGDATATPARSSRWDGAYLAVLLAALWLFASELVSLSRGATSVLVEKPVNLATGCLRWCLRPVFAARSNLMSFLRAARDDAKAD